MKGFSFRDIVTLHKPYIAGGDRDGDRCLLARSRVWFVKAPSYHYYITEYYVTVTVDDVL